MNPEPAKSKLRLSNKHLNYYVITIFIHTYILKILEAVSASYKLPNFQKNALKMNLIKIF